MASRTVLDPRGVEWFVLEVPAHAEEAVGDAMTNGWLVAHSGTDRRRIAPVPADWLAASDINLLLLIRQAPALALASRVTK